MTLTVKLSERDQTRLDAIAIAMGAGSQSDVVRALINEKFESLHAEKTLVERRGGHPVNVLDANPDLSERDSRKAAIASALKAKTRRRSP